MDVPIYFLIFENIKCHIAHFQQSYVQVDIYALQVSFVEFTSHAIETHVGN